MLLIKYSAFALLSLSSAYLSVNMFQSLGADIFAKILLVVIAISLESVKVFSLLRIEYFLSIHTKIFKSQYSSALRASLAIYTLLALLSVLASFGFTLVTVDQQVEVARIDFTVSTEDIDFVIEAKQQSLASLQDSIANLQLQMTTINPDFATGSTRLSTEARALEEQRQLLIAEISTLLQQKSTVIRDLNSQGNTNVYGMFYLMGQPVGLDEKQVMFALLVLISLLIEIGMIYTSPTIIIKTDEMHEIAKTQQPTPKKKQRPKQKKKVATKVAASSVAVTIPVSQVQVEQNSKPVKKVVEPVAPPVVEPVEQKPAEVQPALVLKDLLQISSGSVLKNPVDIAYTNAIPVEFLNKVFRAIADMKTTTGKPFLREEDGVWSLNYSYSYVLDQLAIHPKIQEVLRVLEGKRRR